MKVILNTNLQQMLGFTQRLPRDYSEMAEPKGKDDGNLGSRGVPGDCGKTRGTTVPISVILITAKTRVSLSEASECQQDH